MTDCRSFTTCFHCGAKLPESDEPFRCPDCRTPYDEELRVWWPSVQFYATLLRTMLIAGAIVALPVTLLLPIILIRRGVVLGNYFYWFMLVAAVGIASYVLSGRIRTFVRVKHHLGATSRGVVLGAGVFPGGSSELSWEELARRRARGESIRSLSLSLVHGTLPSPQRAEFDAVLHERTARRVEELLDRWGGAPPPLASEDDSWRPPAAPAGRKTHGLKHEVAARPLRKGRVRLRWIQLFVFGWLAWFGVLARIAQAGVRPDVMTVLMTAPYVVLLAGAFLYTRTDTIRERRRYRARQHDFNACPMCGYLLHGLQDEGHCPECGHPYHREYLLDYWAGDLREGLESPAVAES